MKKLKILTLIIIVICLIIYEIGFCNLYNILKGTYSFSLFRIVLYVTIILLFIFFSKKMIESAVETIKYKQKLIYVYSIITFLYVIFLIFKAEELGKILVILLAELLGLLFIIYISKDYVQNIIVTTLTFGIMFCLINNVYHIMDEKQHFNSALNLAAFNFNYIDEPLADVKFNDVEHVTEMKYFIIENSNKPYKMEMEEIELDVISVPMDYSPILYIPSAIGINIARLFRGTMLDVFLAGRIANLLTYCCLLILVFKLLPFKKKTFYCMYLLPQSIAIAAVYSIDATTVGILGIFIAYTLKIYKENKDGINIKQFLILTGLFLLALISKHGVYLGICVIVFILPIIKSIKKDKRIILLLIGIVLIASVWGLLKLNKISNETSGDEKILDTNPKLQLEFILNNPEKLIELYAKCFNETIFNLPYYEGLNSEYFMGKAYKVISFWLFIFCLYTVINDKTYNFGKKEKFVFISTYLANFFIGTMTLFLLHTPAYIIEVHGYQVRYLLPLLPLILMCINTKGNNEEDEEDEEDEEVYNSTARDLGLFMLLNIISKIMS